MYHILDHLSPYLSLCIDPTKNPPIRYARLCQSRTALTRQGRADHEIGVAPAPQQWSMTEIGPLKKRGVEFNPMAIYTGWWFQTLILFFIFYMGCHPSHWLIFFRGVGIPPTSTWLYMIVGQIMAISMAIPWNIAKPTIKGIIIHKYTWLCMAILLIYGICRTALSDSRESGPQPGEPVDPCVSL